MAGQISNQRLTANTLPRDSLSCLVLLAEDLGRSASGMEEDLGIKVDLLYRLDIPGSKTQLTNNDIFMDRTQVEEEQMQRVA